MIWGLSSRPRSGPASRQQLILEQIEGGKFAGQATNEVAFTSSNERVVRIVVPPTDAAPDACLVLATAAGKIKRTSLAEYGKITAGGLRTLNLAEGDRVVGAFIAGWLLPQLGIAIHVVNPTVTAIIDAIKRTLDDTPPELSGDIMKNGICLTGGGSLLGGFPLRLRHETGMKVHLAKEPLYSVVLGSGRCLEEFDVLQRVLVTPSRR